MSSGIVFAAIFITVWLIYIKGYGDEDASHNNFTVHMPISIGVMGALSLALAVYCSFDLKKNDDGRLLLWTIIAIAAAGTLGGAVAQKRIRQSQGR